MSLVKFTRGTIIGTGLSAGAGEVHDIEEPTAQFFVRQGRAVYVDGAVPADPGIVTVAEAPKPKAARVR